MAEAAPVEWTLIRTLRALALQARVHNDDATLAERACVVVLANSEGRDACGMRVGPVAMPSVRASMGAMRLAVSCSKWIRLALVQFS